MSDSTTVSMQELIEEGFVDQAISHFQRLRRDPILGKVILQYRDMAKGGDGGTLHFGPDANKNCTCREHNYSGYPNEFFAHICKEMGWTDAELQEAFSPGSTGPFGMVKEKEDS